MPFWFPWKKSKSLPTLLHATHIKAGSTWVDAMLRHLFGAKVMPRFGATLFEPGKLASFERLETLQHPPYLEMFQATEFRAGHVYPAMFITHDEFKSRPEFADAKRFAIIRDLRDTLTSHYFSLKDTHALDKLGRVKRARDVLTSSSKDDGMMFLFEHDLERLVKIQRSWLDANELVLRYEDLIQDDVAGFKSLFLDKLQLPLKERDIEKAVKASRFETVYKRKLGELDDSSHGRQGLPGDWKNHFSPRIRQEFQERAGDLLVAAGYEKDSQWTS